MSTNAKATNYKYGVQLDKNGDGGLTDERFVPGLRFTKEFDTFAAADVGKCIFTAPAACKVVRVTERHGTSAGQAGTIQLEKVPSGTAAGSGTVLLSSAIDAAGTTDTNQVKTALTTGVEKLDSGDSLALKTASGALTSLANATITIVLEWL